MCKFWLNESHKHMPYVFERRLRGKNHEYGWCLLVIVCECVCVREKFKENGSESDREPYAHLGCM